VPLAALAKPRISLTSSHASKYCYFRGKNVAATAGKHDNRGSAAH